MNHFIPRWIAPQQRKNWIQRSWIDWCNWTSRSSQNWFISSYNNHYNDIQYRPIRPLNPHNGEHHVYIFIIVMIVNIIIIIKIIFMEIRLIRAFLYKREREFWNPREVQLCFERESWIQMGIDLTTRHLDNIDFNIINNP